MPWVLGAACTRAEQVLAGEADLSMEITMIIMSDSCSFQASVNQICIESGVAFCRAGWLPLHDPIPSAMTGRFLRLAPCTALLHSPVFLPFAPRSRCFSREQPKLAISKKPRLFPPAASPNTARASLKSIPVTRLNTACQPMQPLRPCEFHRSLRVNMPSLLAGSSGVFRPPLGPPIARSCSPLLPDPNASFKPALLPHCQAADPWCSLCTDGIARPMALLQRLLVIG